jgi:hypothetical protein
VAAVRLAAHASQVPLSRHRSPHNGTSHGVAILQAFKLQPFSDLQPLPTAVLYVAAGCGVVSFACRESAVAAMEALNKKHTWPDSEAPMVVEWMDPSRQAAAKQRSNGQAGAHCAAGCCRVLPTTVPLEKQPFGEQRVTTDVLLAGSADFIGHASCSEITTFQQTLTCHRSNASCVMQCCRP